MNRSFFRENVPLTVGLVVTAIGISAAAIIFHQQFWRILPLYVSLFVALFQSRMMRAAPLLGGINSILYAAVYFTYSLYGSAAYALLISCPIQLAAFVRWSRKPRGYSTVFRTLTLRARLAVAAIFAASYAALCAALYAGGGKFVFLDGAITVLGVILSTVLYIRMLADTPEQTTYLVFNVYSLACTTAAAFRIRKVCEEQNEEKAKEEKTSASPPRYDIIPIE